MSVTKASSKSAIIRMKNTSHSDIPAITRLITPAVVQLYGSLDLEHLLEVCSGALTLYNAEEDAVATVVLCDYPNVGSVKSEWPTWISNVYGLKHLTPLNARFIHLMAFDYDYYPEFFHSMMECFYSDNQFLDFIVLLLPPNSGSYDLLHMYFNRIHKLKDTPPKWITTCYVNNRWIHFGKFVMNVFRENVFEFPLKPYPIDFEEKRYHKISVWNDKTRTIIVGDSSRNEELICLNQKINLSSLAENYDLHPVNGFLSKSPREMILTNDLNIPTSDIFNRSSAHNDWSPVEDVEGPSYAYTEDDFFDDVNLRFEDIIILDPEKAIEAVAFMTRLTSTDTDTYGARATSSSKGILQKIKNPSFSSANRNKTKALKDYNGEINAFSLELFISYNSKARNIDYLRKIFEFSPNNLNYCIVEVPYACDGKPPSIFNYFHKFKKLNKFHPYELYVTHQTALLGNICVREAWPSDIESVLGMTLAIPDFQNFHRVVNDILCDLDRSSQLYLLLSDNLPVGVAVVRKETGVDYLRSRYELDEMMCTKFQRMEEFGEVTHIIVSPFFKFYIRFFLKEIMRLANYSALFYKLFRKSVLRSLRRTWPSELLNWVPVLPRILSKATVNLTMKTDLDSDETMSHPFALFFINRRIASMTLTLDNKDVVIVGFGNTAISLVQHLVHNKHKLFYNFNSIKVIRPDRFVHWESSKFYEDYTSLMPINGRYSRRYLDTVGLDAYIDFICGYMTEIDHEKQFVKVNFKYDVHYDYLFLLCGTQFSKPDLISEFPNTDNMHSTEELEKEHTYQPINFFVLNSLADVDNFFDYIKQMKAMIKEGENIIVYGGNINAWACVNYLLKYLPGNFISFLEESNDPVHNIGPFNNVLIHQACKRNLLASNVKLYSACHVKTWIIMKKDNTIENVLFYSGETEVTLSCSLFISFTSKSIHPITKLSLVESNLDVDDKLIIDHRFRTPDSRIFAAGSMTKYSSEYCFEHFNHEYYDSYEVGSKLAEVFLEINQRGQSDENKPEKETPLLIEMKEPIVVSCVLPKGINYLRVSPPGPLVPFQQLAALDRVGKILSTGDVYRTGDPKYFRIILDKFDKVMEVTCFTTQDIDIVAMTRLYGKHHQLFNEICWKYDNNLIEDLYEYFKQPWASIIYHDRFSEFLNNIFPLHKNIKDPTERCKYIKLATILDTKNDEKKKLIKAKMMKILHRNGLDKRMCDSLMEFLELNKNLLPEYLTPSDLRRHQSDSYYLNQLLEPPSFARLHMDGYIKSFSPDNNEISDNVYTLPPDNS